MTLGEAKAMTDCSQSTVGMDSPDVRRSVYGLAWLFARQGMTNAI
ncbi:hypothetical protein [Reichenbachiella agariperforans]|nr:hypothetical protein [Reichenbachiella agariperforans]